MDPAIGAVQHADKNTELLDPTAIADMVSRKYGPQQDPVHQNKEHTMETTTPEASCKRQEMSATTADSMPDSKSNKSDEKQATLRPLQTPDAQQRN